MKKENKNDDSKEFENLTATSNIFIEFWEFLAENKKLWLIPIILIMLLLGLLIFMGSTAAAPFIYTLF